MKGIQEGGVKICHVIRRARKDTGSGVDRYSGELIDALNDLCVDLVIVEQGKLNIAFPIAKLPATIQTLRINADIFHLTSHLSMSAILLGRKHQLIVTMHDLLAFPNSLTSFHRKDFSLQKLYSQYCTALAKYARMVIVPFDITKIDLAETLGFSPEKIRVINYGINHSRFRLMPNIETEGSEIILFLGDADWREGFDTVLQAFSALSRELSVDLYVGGKTAKPHIQRLLKAYDIDRRKVRLLGYVPESDLPRLYNEAAVYVFPSRAGFGLSILEAMACGTPVVASNTEDVKEVVDGGALTVTPGNVTELREALRRVLTDSNLRKKLSGKGLSQSRRFSWRTMASETLSLYSEISG